MNIFQLIKFLWDNRKGAEYVRRTGNIPLCECYDYLKDGDCEHIEEAREDISHIMKKKLELH